MWNHMTGTMGYGWGLGGLIWLALVVWFVIFTALVVGKMNRIIQLLEKKQ